MAPPAKLPLLPEKVLLVTLSVPKLAMAPPWLAVPFVALLPEKVLLVTTRGPPLAMAPPALPNPVADPSAMVRFSTANVRPEFTRKTPTPFPQLLLITLPR